MLIERFGLSQRRACQIVGQHRSTQRHQCDEPDPDRDLRERLRRFAKRHPRWGYRRAHAVLRREGWAVNRKKVQRLWREEGLRVPAAPASVHRRPCHFRATLTGTERCPTVSDGTEKTGADQAIIGFGLVASTGQLTLPR